MFPPSQVSLCVGMLCAAKFIPDGFWPTLLVPWGVLVKVIYCGNRGPPNFVGPSKPTVRRTRFFPSCSFSGSGFVQCSCDRQSPYFLTSFALHNMTRNCDLDLAGKSLTKFWAVVLLPMMFLLNMFFHIAEETEWHLWIGRIPGPCRWTDGPLVWEVFQSSLASCPETKSLENMMSMGSCTKIGSFLGPRGHCYWRTLFVMLYPD